MVDKIAFFYRFQSIQSHLMTALFEADPILQGLLYNPAARTLKAFGGGIDLLGQFDRNMGGKGARLHIRSMRS